MASSRRSGRPDDAARGGAGAVSGGAQGDAVGAAVDEALRRLADASTLLVAFSGGRGAAGPRDAPGSSRARRRRAPLARPTRPRPPRAAGPDPRTAPPHRSTPRLLEAVEAVHDDQEQPVFAVSYKNMTQPTSDLV